MLGTLIGNRMVGICNDKSLPIGFFMEDKNDNDHPQVDSEIDEQTCMADILIGCGEYQTDIFESSEYHINDFLYCSCDGKITNEICYKGNIVVGVVNCVLDGKIGFISTPFSRGLDLETFQIKNKIEGIKEKYRARSRFEILKNS